MSIGSFIALVEYQEIMNDMMDHVIEDADKIADILQGYVENSRWDAQKVEDWQTTVKKRIVEYQELSVRLQEKAIAAGLSTIDDVVYTPSTTLE